MRKSVRVSEEFHEFVAAHKRDGESGIGKVDSMVAAVSDLYDEPVLTADVEDFEALGVAVETY